MKHFFFSNFTVGRVQQRIRVGMERGTSTILFTSVPSKTTRFELPESIGRGRNQGNFRNLNCRYRTDNILDNFRFQRFTIDRIYL